MVAKAQKKPLLPDEVVELKGDWGKGGQGIGELFCLQKAALLDLKGDHRGQILALEESLSRGLWHKAKSLGMKGIVCGGLPDKKFSREIEKEVLLIGEERKDLALPLVVFGGEGKIPAEIWQVLVQNQGRKVVVEGDHCRLLIPK